MAQNEWNEGMAPIGHTSALPAKIGPRFRAKQPRGLHRSWLIWDGRKKEWVSNFRGEFRRFKSQDAAEKAARKLNS